MASTVITYSDIETAMVSLTNRIIETAPEAPTPMFNRFKVMDKKIITRHGWPKKIFSSLTDTVNNSGVISSSATEFVVTGPTASNPFKYYPGITVLRVDTEFMLLEQMITSTRVKVQRAYLGSTAVQHADGSTVHIGAINPFGSGRLGRNDTNFAGEEYNIFRNFQNEFTVANAMDRVQSYVGVNEADDAEQLVEIEYDAQITAEKDFFYGFRYEEGDIETNAIGVRKNARSGNTYTAGVDYFISQHGGLNIALSGNPLTKRDMQLMVRLQRARGIFSRRGSFTTRTDKAQLLWVCHEGQYDYMQQLVWGLIRQDEASKVHGSDIDTFNMGGIMCKIEPSVGVNATDVFSIPNRPDWFKIRVSRFVEKQPDVPDGDNHGKTYCTTYINEIPQGYVLGKFSGAKAPATA